MSTHGLRHSPISVLRTVNGQEEERLEYLFTDDPIESGVLIVTEDTLFMLLVPFCFYGVGVAAVAAFLHFYDDGIVGPVYPDLDSKRAIDILRITKDLQSVAAFVGPKRARMMDLRDVFLHFFHIKLSLLAESRKNDIQLTFRPLFYPIRPVFHVTIQCRGRHAATL